MAYVPLYLGTEGRRLQQIIDGEAGQSGAFQLLNSAYDIEGVPEPIPGPGDEADAAGGPYRYDRRGQPAR